MGLCQAIENRHTKILQLRKTYPRYHETALKEKDNKSIEDYEIELWDHYLKFNQYKDDLSKSHPGLYKKFFDPKIHFRKLEVENIRGDDDDKFLFFFNKRQYKDLTMSNSQIVFPRFSFQCYPKYKEEKSTLSKLVITNSKILFDEKLTFYAKLENVRSLELSYCNIELLPSAFSKIKNIQKLCLRRNLLRSLPKTFIELRDIEDLDISENKFVSLPKEIFQFGYKIAKLNMTGNLLETFEVFGDSEKMKLECLFLSQNSLTKIPLDINKFPLLMYVNLDENNIIEHNHNLNEELALNVKISCLKNKGISEIIEVRRPEGYKKKEESVKEKEGKKRTTRRTTNVLAKNIYNTFRKKEKRDSFCKAVNFELLRIKAPTTQLENELSLFIDNKIIEACKLNVSYIESAKKSIIEEQYFFMVEKIDILIQSGREKEIGMIDNYELKELFKKCYGTYLRLKEYNNTGVLPIKLEEMEPLEREYFIKKVYNIESNNANDPELLKKIQEKRLDNKIKQREDVSNLIYLKQINQLVASSKVKIFLQYLGNIDCDIREHLISLWEIKDNNSFILLLTELKLFVKEMINFYKSKMRKGTMEVRYEVMTSEDKNVIHDIFYNVHTLRILYRLGIIDKKEIFKGHTQEQITFLITNVMNDKHTQFENFLMRFIHVLKITKADPTDFE